MSKNQAAVLSEEIESVPIRNGRPRRVESISDPHRLARAFIDSFRDADGNCRLVLYRGTYYQFSGSTWEPMKHDIRRIVTKKIREEFDRVAGSTVLPGLAPGDSTAGLHVTRGLAGDVIQAIESELPILDDLEPPFWIDEREDDPPANGLIATRNALVRIDEVGGVLPVSPRFFTLDCLPCDYSPESGDGAQWNRFLKSIWQDDEESVRELQKFFGYCLTDDTSHHKMLCIIGPSRSGKGTIVNALVDMIGEGREQPLSLSSLDTQFGLQRLHGKKLGVLSDSRTSKGRDYATAIERILRIVGGDSVEIDRKNRESTAARIKAKLVMVSNEIPGIEDPGGAIFQRLLVLQTLKEVLAPHRDRDLGKKLRNEISAILNWAIKGLRLLNEEGFSNPEASKNLASEIARKSDPLASFIRDECVLGSDSKIACDELYEAFKAYHSEHFGSERIPGKSSFGSQLATLGKTKHSRGAGVGKRPWIYTGIDLRR